MGEYMTMQQMGNRNITNMPLVWRNDIATESKYVLQDMQVRTLCLTCCNYDITPSTGF
jgi:hypothetical protein